MSEGPIRHVAIIGLGLMGGSLARDFAASGIRISAYDTDDMALRHAHASGVVSGVLDATLAGVAEADVVVLAVPIDVAPDLLARVAEHAMGARLITDVGSTKARIVAAASALGLGSRFVGSHPMAGDHRSGWVVSRTGLFAGARVYLSAPDEAPDGLIHFASSLWTSLGGRPVVVPAELHDQKLAWASHLPHVVSAALALALAGAGVPRNELGPGGRDVTRLAGSSPEMWTAIARENADAIDEALAQTQRELASFRAALRCPDAGDVRRRFADARAWFER